MGFFFLVRPTDDKAKQQKESPVRLLRKEQINLNIPFFLPVKYLKQCRGENNGCIFLLVEKTVLCRQFTARTCIHTTHVGQALYF